MLPAWQPSLSASFVYNGEGRRALLTVVGVTTAFIGDYYEWRGSAAALVSYYYAGGTRVAMRMGSGTPKYLLGDHLGSTNGLVNGDGRGSAFGPEAGLPVLIFSALASIAMLCTAGLRFLYHFRFGHFFAYLTTSLLRHLLSPPPCSLNYWVELSHYYSHRGLFDNYSFCRPGAADPMEDPAAEILPHGTRNQCSLSRG